MDEFKLLNEAGLLNYFSFNLDGNAKFQSSNNLVLVSLFENFFVYEDYLFIKLKRTPKLIVFKCDYGSSFAVFKSIIKLKNDSPISNFCFIDINNVFFTQISNANENPVKTIYTFNFEKIQVKFIKELSLNNLSIDKKSKDCLRINEKVDNLFFGFLSINNELYLIYKLKDEISFNTVLILDFKIEITDIFYSKMFNYLDGIFYLVIIFCKDSIYYKLLKFKTFNLENMIELLKKKWTKLYSIQKFLSSYIHCIFHNHSNNLRDYKFSILIFENGEKMFIYSIDKNYYFPNANSEEFISIFKEKEYIRDLNLKGKIKTNSIISLNYYNYTIFLAFPDKIIEINTHHARDTIIYDKFSMRIISAKCVILDSYDKKNSNFSNKNNYLILSENKMHIIKIKRLNTTTHFLSSTDAFKFRADNIEHRRTGTIMNLISAKFPTSTKSASSEATLYEPDVFKIGSSSDRNEKDEKTILCSNCIRKAKFRCNLCKNFFSCSAPSIHEIEWKNHVKNCPKVIENNNDVNSNDNTDNKNNNTDNTTNKTNVNINVNNNNENKEDAPHSLSPRKKHSISLGKNKIIKELGKFKEEAKFNLIKYKNIFTSDRNNIFTALKKHAYINALRYCSNLVKKNINNLLDFISKRKIINFSSIEKISKFRIEEFINSYLYYEEYFSNILLNIHIYILIKSKDKVFRILNRLIREMETYNYSRVTEHIILTLGEQENPKNKALRKKCEEIYFRTLKTYICIAKYAFSLKDYHLYEEYVLSFVQKIQLVFKGNKHIIFNTYLLLGNLYLGTGKLKKAHILYEEIIHKSSSSTRDFKLLDILICANYNSGLIFYLINKCDLAKQRLESALKMKRDSIKEKYDISLCEIYETLAEIEIESKCFSSAFSYLEKASEILDSININDSIEKKTIESKSEIEKYHSIKKKISILSEFIEQKNYENINTISSESQNNTIHINNNQNSSNIHKVNSLLSSNNFNSANSTLKRRTKIDDAEDDKLLADFLNTDYEPQIIREANTEELKNFYLFISSLSEKQIKHLNSDQPKNYEQSKKLPIVFTKEFKDSLNHKQRYHFTQLRLTNLSRMRVLRNYNKKIKIKNLNYNALYKQEKQPIINVINSNYETKKILKNWESDKVEPIKNKKDTSEWENIKKEKPEVEKKIEIVNLPKKEELNKKEIEKLSNEILGRELIDYDKFKMYVLYFFKENYPERLNSIDNDFFLLLTREMEKENLKKIILNPETLNDILDTYLVYKEENIQQIQEEERIREEERKQKEEEKEEEEEGKLNRLVTIKRITFDGL